MSFHVNGKAFTQAPRPGQATAPSCAARISTYCLRLSPPQILFDALCPPHITARMEAVSYTEI
jgi:hypothetical protein